MSDLITPRVLKLHEACRYVGLSEGTFLNSIGREVPPLRMSPGRKGWDRLALDRWVDARTRESEAGSDAFKVAQEEAPLDYLIS
ncbi:helix-turn-helix transcriptional regulator [Asaia prunellae]|uniref:helix-turn-helix transcriptional regulator n=1 Tax=Asaia prunellae TaxID=610245 RepID=UPI0004726372|nr:hypothetical protein [Asaia prunellae]